MTPATWFLLVLVLAGVLARQADGIRHDHHRLLADLTDRLELPEEDQ